MGIYKENYEGSEPDPEVIEPEGIMITLEDGSILQGSMLLDKDGNETEILFDAVKILARRIEGGDDIGWFEISIQGGSWELPMIH